MQRKTIERATTWLARFGGVAAMIAMSSATHAASNCFTGVSADNTSKIYGMRVGYTVTNATVQDGIESCTTTFKTLEEAEYAIRQSPGRPSWPSAELAFPLPGDFFASPTSLITYDYRPYGSLGSGSAVLQGPPATLISSYLPFVKNWPPSTVPSQCQSLASACTSTGCPSLAAAASFAQCEFNATWGPSGNHPGFCWQSSASPTTVSNFQAGPTSIQVGGNLTSGTLNYSPTSSTDTSHSTLKLSATSCAGTLVGEGSVEKGAREATANADFTWSLKRRDDITCSGGARVNASASSTSNACSTPFDKVTFPGQSFQQSPQCGEGNPCHPGSGNKSVTERGFRYGEIDFDLHYNSLRQLRPYSYIDRNWSHSFAKRLLSAWSTDNHMSNQVDTVYIQNERAELEAFVKLYTSGNTTVFRATYKTGDLLYYSKPTPPAAENWQLVHADGVVDLFDVAGRFVGIVHPDDPRQTLTISYLNPGNLVNATGAVAGAESYQEPFWRVSQITDGTGRFVTFQYTADQYYWLSRILADDGVTILMQFTYDGQHRLTDITQFGKTRHYFYNEPSNVDVTGSAVGYWLTGIEDEDHRRFATYQYDDWGRAKASWRGADAGKVTLSYPSDAQGLPTDNTVTVTLPTGAVRTYAYSATTPYRQPDTVQQSAGPTGPSVTRLRQYDPTTRRVSQETDANGNTTLHIYEASTQANTLQGAHEIKRVEALGTPQQRRIETDWDGASNRVKERRIYADPSDPTNSQVGTLETKTTYAYDPASGHITSRTETDPINGNTSVWTYTYCPAVNAATGCAAPNLLQAVDGPRTAVSDVTTYAYYMSTDLTGCTSGPGGACHHVKDLKSATNALGHVTTYLSYDRAGRVTRIQDANGVISDFLYDPRGWMTDRIVRANADGTASSGDATLHMDLDGSGNITKMTQPDGSYLVYGYDTAHRLTDVIDSQNGRIHYTLDKAGHRTKEETFDSTYDPAHPGQGLKRSLARDYDQLGHLLNTRNAANAALATYQNPADAPPAGVTYINGYDGDGNPVYNVNANGMASLRQYDPLNRLMTSLLDHTGVTSTKDTATQFRYDARGNLRKVIDPGNLETTYVVDGLNRLTDLYSPDTGHTHYTYDPAGNRLTQTDARNVTRTYTYDALNRLTGTTYVNSSSNVSLAYDQSDSTTGCTSSFPKGRLTRMSDASGSTTYCYDRRGNLTRKTQVTGTGTLVQAATYTLADRLFTLTYPSGGVAEYTYTAGQVTKLTWRTSAGATPVDVLSTASYAPFGPLTTLSFGNGRTLTKAYDQNYMVDYVASSAANGLVLDLTTDAMGNITDATNVVAGVVQRHYDYDPLYRLTAVSPRRSAPLESFSYNATGDRTSKTVAGGAAQSYLYEPGSHRLASIAGVARASDPNGNTLDTGANPRFSYGDDNRMNVAYWINSGGGGEEGRSSSATGTVTAFANYRYNGMGERVLKETYGEIGPPEQRFMYSSSGHLLGNYGTGLGSPVAQEYLYLGELPVAVVTEGALAYVETDHLGTPRAVANPANNALLWRWNFLGSAFGEHQPDDGNGNPPSLAFNLRYPGQYLDPESGIQYNYFRDYEAATGRYLESDPTGLRGGLSTYAYANHAPTRNVDPQGLFSIDSSCKDCEGSDSTVPEIEAAAKRACRESSLKITNNSALRSCIQNRCEDDDTVITCQGGPLECESKGGSDNLGRVWVAEYGEELYTLRIPEKRLNLCVKTIREYPDPLSNVILHETAHTCGWQHEDRDGVPRPSGHSNNPPWR